MNLDPLAIVLQTLLLLLLAPLLERLHQELEGQAAEPPRAAVWQPYFDLAKFLRKDMVISEHASWVFSCAPYVVFITRAAGRPDGADGHAPRRR